VFAFRCDSPRISHMRCAVVNFRQLYSDRQ
jgi:hypothetical protein